MKKLAATLILLGAAFPARAQAQDQQIEDQIASAAPTVAYLSEVDEQPLRLGGRALRYPPMLLSAGISGDVVIRYVIDIRGKAVDSTITVIDSPSRSFSQAAIDFIKRSRFQPARKDGLPVAVQVEQVVAFKAHD